MKPPLQIPVLFGHWLVQGDKLVCRLPRKTVTVRAPRRLLAEVMELCDGSRTWANVHECLGAKWAPETIASFMLELAGQQVLVESAQLWAHWSDVAQLPQPTGTTSSEDEMAQLPQKARFRLLPGKGILRPELCSGCNPLVNVLRARKTSRTFGDAPISVQTLCSILWAAHGVAGPAGTEEVGWRRTTASGGNMHSARWFVAVLRDLPSMEPGKGGIAAGIYEARFHVEGGASLQPLDGRALDAWRCLSDPRSLHYASAVVFPVYDIAVPSRKYGNRATLFATIEAGQCMQNAQLMAASVGVACAMRGDTVATEVLALAGLEQKDDAHWLAMPGLVLGSEPSELQRRQQALDTRFRVAPNLQPPTLSGARMIGFAATYSGPQGAEMPGGSGRASDPRLAITKAQAEAWERMGWAAAKGLLEAPAQALRDYIRPQELVAYSQAQYASPRFAFAPFRPERTCLWREAVDAMTGRAHAVLAECVHALHGFPPDYQTLAYTQASTSGVAAGTSADDALMRATLELIERDAFLCAWLAGEAPVRVSPESLPRSVQVRILELQQAGLETGVFDISTAWAPVLALFTQAPGLPFTTITAAASLCKDDALLRALEEAEGRFAQAQSCTVRKADDGDAIQQIERYYGSLRTYRRSDFFARATETMDFSAVAHGCARGWDELRSRIQADGFRLLAVDITPSGAAIHQGRTPLHVARAFVPGLVPIWFQRGLQPQGMPRFRKAAGMAGGRPAGHFVHPFT